MTVSSGPLQSPVGAGETAEMAETAEIFLPVEGAERWK